MSADRRLRVLWLIKGLGAGGAERLLVSMAGARDRDRFEYRAAYLLPWKHALVPELEALEVPVGCFDVRDERDLRWAGALRRQLLDEHIDVVHAHSPYVAGIARLVRLSLLRTDRPGFVSTEHNAWPTFALPTRVLNGLTFPAGDAAIAVSRHVRDSVWSPLRSRVRPIVHGVPLEAVRAERSRRDEARDELGVGPDEVLLGTVANYNAKKDYPTLLEATRLLISRGLPVRVCAVGQGPLEGNVRRLRDRLGLTDRVVITGYREDALRLMAGYDLFVLASRYEGLPVAVMEALALGLPVVATAVGGVPEAVRDGVEGQLVAAGRPDQLAAAIEPLARDPALRSRMSTAAAQRGQWFDIASTVREVETIYRAVASR